MCERHEPFEPEKCDRMSEVCSGSFASILACPRHGRVGHIPPKRKRKEPIGFSPSLCNARNLVERFFNKIKQCRRIATRYDKLAANYLAFVKLAAVRIRLRVYESRHANGGGRTGFQEIRGGSFPHMRSTGVLDLDFNAALQ